MQQVETVVFPLQTGLGLMLSLAIIGVNREAFATPKSAGSIICRSILRLTLYTKRKMKMKNAEVRVWRNLGYEQKRYLLK